MRGKGKKKEERSRNFYKRAVLLSRQEERSNPPALFSGAPHSVGLEARAVAPRKGHLSGGRTRTRWLAFLARSSSSVSFFSGLFVGYGLFKLESVAFFFFLCACLSPWISERSGRIRSDGFAFPFNPPGIIALASPPRQPPPGADGESGSWASLRKAGRKGKPRGNSLDQQQFARNSRQRLVLGFSFSVRADKTMEEGWVDGWHVACVFAALTAPIRLLCARRRMA